MPRVLNKRTATAEQIDGGVYIGRPSKWGNPFQVDHFGGYTRAEAIERFESYLRNNPRLMAAAKRELRGRDLICWCAPKACHGDVLLRIANEES